MRIGEADFSKKLITLQCLNELLDNKSQKCLKKLSKYL